MIRLKLRAPVAIAFVLALSGSFPGWAQSPSAVSNDPIAPLIFNAPPDPPPTGQPGRRSDAGSRGCGGEESSMASEPLPLLALVPVQETAGSTVVFGQTAAEYPTFWFYVPYDASFTATFVLQDQEGNPVYESDVPLPQSAGIFSLTLPATATPLEPGQPYHWFFKLYCDGVSPPDFFVDGWIQRETLSPDLAQQLQAATPQDQVRLYAANGFWFDALTTVVNLHRIDPEDAAWTDLLDAVNLDHVANEEIFLP